MIAIWMILCHLVGDYVIQTDHMAQEMEKNLREFAAEYELTVPA